MTYTTTCKSSGWDNRHLKFSQLAMVVERFCIIDQFHKSQDASVSYPTMLYSEQKCAYICSEWSIVGYGTGAFCDLWIRSIEMMWCWRCDVLYKAIAEKYIIEPIFPCQVYKRCKVGDLNIFTNFVCFCLWMLSLCSDRCILILNLFASIWAWWQIEKKVASEGENLTVCI